MDKATIGSSHKLPEADDNTEFCQNEWIHPLLHRNITTLSEQRFSSEFTGEELFVTDTGNGQLILQEAVLLEMASQAIKCSINSQKYKNFKVKLKNITWIEPIHIPATVYAGIYPDSAASDQSSEKEQGIFIVEIFTESSEGERQIHCR
ncbi:MAG: hypothetical protein P8Y42_21535, partial [Exilibacterium sp.]